MLAIIQINSCVAVSTQDTPLVRASGRELIYVILGGLFLSYLNTFILLAKPGVVVCTLQRFTVGKLFAHLKIPQPTSQRRAFIYAYFDLTTTGFIRNKKVVMLQCLE